jgi:hypothetical protein
MEPADARVPSLLKAASDSWNHIDEPSRACSDLPNRCDGPQNRAQIRAKKINKIKYDFVEPLRFIIHTAVWSALVFAEQKDGWPPAKNAQIRARNKSLFSRAKNATGFCWITRYDQIAFREMLPKRQYFLLNGLRLSNIKASKKVIQPARA